MPAGFDFHLIWSLGLSLVALAAVGFLSWRERPGRRTTRRRNDGHRLDFGD